jgi:hypothetical protein
VYVVYVIILREGLPGTEGRHEPAAARAGAPAPDARPAPELAEKRG